MADLKRFFAALAAMGEAGPTAVEQLHTALERIPTTIQTFKESPMPTILTTAFATLSPPLADPTRLPRRTDGPRLRVRAVDGHKITLPAADARNLTGSREPLLFVAEWEIWLIDEDGREQMLEHHGTGVGALHALPRLMRQLGLLNEDGSHPSVEGGVSDAA